MKRTVWTLGAVMVVPLSTSVPATAHHSAAMFDMETVATVEGTIKEFEWSSPHGYLIVTVGEDARDWVLELGSLQRMAAEGIRVDTFKPGENVKASFHPVRTGSPAGQFMSATLEDGTVVVMVDEDSGP